MSSYDAANRPADNPRDTASNRQAIALTLLATFVVALNETIIGVAIPRIMDDLTIDANTAQWLSTAFLLTAAVIIPMTGFIMQRMPTRAVFVLAMSLFSVGTAIGAIAPGFELLLIGRIIQGGGTAIVIPLLLSTVMTLAPRERRGRTMGRVAVVSSVAPAIGPAIGGLVVQLLDWRYIFIIVLPIALLALILGVARVKNLTAPAVTPLDIPSAILSTLGFGGVVYGLSSLGSTVGNSAEARPWIPLTAGSVALVLFVLRQFVLQRVDRPFLDLRTFRSRGFSMSVVLIIVTMGALFGIGLMLPIYSQEVLGLGAALSGLILVPGALVMGLAGPFVGRLYDRVGPRALILSGSIAVSLVLWAMTQLSENTPWGYVLVADVGLSAGLAFVFTPLFSSSMAALPPNLYAHGSATLSTVQQLGGAAGTALFVALYTVGTATALENGASEVGALAAGVHTSFVASAIASLAAVVVACFIPTPVEFAGHDHSSGNA